MSATPLTSDGATINYTVTVNNVPYATKTNTTAVPVLTVSSLSELDAKSLPIAVTVARSEYDSAVQGTYEGSVTFEYKAANWSTPYPSMSQVITWLISLPTPTHSYMSYVNIIFNNYILLKYYNL